jgi:uncharacterized protein (DUF1800 family)
MIDSMVASAPPAFRPPGLLPASPLAPYAGPWNARLAAHLLRRAGFGGSPSDIQTAAGQTMNAAVDALIHFPSTDSLPEGPELIDNDEATPIALPQAMASPMPDATGADPATSAIVEARKARQMLRRRQELANVTWWLDRMLVSPAPLQEKMTLYLHGHFATASGTKGIYGTDIVDQNWLLRHYALGNWRDLTHQIARDRAMLKWLDNARNVKAHPNENFARELMELFTLGIGNYTENDVRESARAFTGYTFRRRTGEFYFNATQHDGGDKTFLGHTGNLNGDDVIDIIFTQPTAPKYFARRLLEFFVYSDPEPELVDALAATIRKNDFNMAPVMSVLFRSNVFYSDRTYRALVKSPVEFAIGSYKLFGFTQVAPQTVGVLNRMGQVPFHPPSVKGWDGGAQWLNTQTILARENFASEITTAAAQSKNFLNAAPPAPARDEAQSLTHTILQGDASPASVADLESYLDGRGTSADGTLSGENFEERMRGAAYLTMAMPAYQLS